MRLGELLYRFRLLSGRSIRDLAAEIGIPYPTLSRIERGKEMSGTTLAKILTWLTEPWKKDGVRCFCGRQDCTIHPQATPEKDGR